MTIADTSLTPELRYWNDVIRELARKAGLDFFDTIFELVDYEQLYEIAAYGGFPTRYPHWRFGMDYDQLSKGYEWGVSKIYELVINNDPAYAFLLRGNEFVAQKLVIAHVYAHVDFFKNNIWFSKTNRKMMNELANHATKVRRYIDRFGLEEVENFIDLCLSIEDLIDPVQPFAQRASRKTDRLQIADEKPVQVTRFEAKSYMDKFINPPEVLAKERKRLEEERKKARRFPSEDKKDILLFLLHYAPLEAWQLDILDIIRDEAYYFAPQRMTKIMNEGWASYWHSTLMSEQIASTAEIVDFADLHSGTMAGGGALNPYKLGLDLYRDIEYRWNTGRHGKEWEECDDYEKKLHWDTGEMKGREKIFEVRKFYNDLMFIDEFLTEEFCEKHKLFVYEYNELSGRYEIDSRSHIKIKEKLTLMLANLGQPYIYVHNANYQNRGELLLIHRHQGIDLRDDWARDTLANIAKLWSRPVVLHTFYEGKPYMLRHDGKNFTETEGKP